MDSEGNCAKAEIVATAARLVVDEGLQYGPAKRRALRQLGLAARTPLPANEELEDAVLDHIALFCADTQPAELAALRRLALRWMERMEGFRPYLSGAVWRGTATRRSDIQLDLFCDDSKSAEIALIDFKLAYEPRTVTGMRGDAVDTLSLHDFCDGIDEMVGVHMLIYDLDDLRGALRLDARGRPPRGDLRAVREVLQAAVTQDGATP